MDQNVLQRLQDGAGAVFAHHLGHCPSWSRQLSNDLHCFSLSTSVSKLPATGMLHPVKVARVLLATTSSLLLPDMAG